MAFVSAWRSFEDIILNEIKQTKTKEASTVYSHLHMLANEVQRQKAGKWLQGGSRRRAWVVQ